MKKTIVIALTFTAAALAQPIGFGVKGGLPLQDAFNYKTIGSSTPFTVGPMVELRLPFGLGVEADALYNRYNLTFSQFYPNVQNSDYASSWEIPILLKYRVGKLPLIHPY